MPSCSSLARKEPTREATTLTCASESATPTPLEWRISMPELHFNTRTVHSGRDQGPLQDPAEPQPDGLGTPVSPGIQPSSAYYFDSLDSLDRAFDNPSAGFVYARHGGQTGQLFAKAVATLESADGAVAFSSGMAAVHAA